MTTIQEDPELMDEFFNFEDAAHALDFESGPYDIDLAFAEPEIDEDTFACLQHFSSPGEPLSSCLNSTMTDTRLMGPDDFTDFPRWIDGMVVPTQSCAYCQRMRIHCKVIKEGMRKGSCTSCVALARSCSLTHPNPTRIQKDEAHQCPRVLGLPGNSVDDSIECDGNDWCARVVPEPCDSCRLHGLVCNPVPGGGSHLSCSNCVSFACPCSLANGDVAMEGMIIGNSASETRIEPFPEHSRSDSNLVSLGSSDENPAATVDNGPKVGARFSKESLRILRSWLSTHSGHPYPSDEEKEQLRRQTGLNKTQITNWLANARRRGKVRAPRSTSPSVRNYANGMDIPRRSTPALEHMNPLERWKNSPPEHEPASVTAIAKAVTSASYSTGAESPYTSYGHTDDGSNRSLCNVSSASSLGTSGSSGRSFASAFSHNSQNSFGSFGSMVIRGRRRRRKAASKPVKVAPMAAPPRTFQCTFCTETFKTKHDWQRHEKSLHLSLERWVCCPDGPVQISAESGGASCVFCGLANPSPDHAEVHNYSSCAERSLEERTFYRKDHLRQHLHLVHDVKFQGCSMEHWKVATPEIRSRCGFCGFILDSWSIRVDHLAEHFKGGKSMADWKGDWGFEQQVLDIVENGIPPYLIHDERNSMDPFEASKETQSSERTLEDLVKLGLLDYIHKVTTNGGTPTDDDLLVEARRIIRNADAMMMTNDANYTWFRDLIMLSGVSEKESIEYTAQAGPAYTKKLELISAQVKETRDLSQIICSKHRALISFVENKQALGLTPMDRELQIECCKILDDVEATANFKCKPAVDWFKYLVRRSSSWLCSFRKRCGLPRSSEIASEHIRSEDEKSIDYITHNHARLVRELMDWTNFQLASGKTPNDDEIMSQARMIVYNNDDPWNQTSIEDPAILHLFKRQAGLAPRDEPGATIIDLPPISETLDLQNFPGQQHSASPFISKTLHWPLEGMVHGTKSPGSGSGSGSNSAIMPNHEKPLHTLVSNQPSCNTNPTMPLRFFLNDANCYGRLVGELQRFVTTCMSSNNPNQHIPSDAEIQNQARWIIYDDDDPWNQTAADNAEWLIRFKRDVGLAPAQDGPGLPDTTAFNATWRVDMDGTGFSPPYVCPNNPPAVTKFKQDVPVSIRDKVYNIKARTAGKFLESMQQRWQKPALVFCSRELEEGLNEFVRNKMTTGSFPTDEDLKTKAREILGVAHTSAEDPELLAKFKAMHGVPSTTQPGDNLPIFEIDDQLLADFDTELSNMDLTNLDVPTLSQDISMDMNIFGSPSLHMMGFHSEMDFQSLGSAVSSSSSSSQTSLLSQSLASSPGRGAPLKSPSKGPGMAPDFAEMAKVHAATASPLRRRASAKMVEQSGIEMPLTLVRMQKQRGSPKLT